MDNITSLQISNGKVGTAGLAVTREAFAIVGAKLYVPKAAEAAGQAQDPDSGIAVRRVSIWDGYRSMQIVLNGTIHCTSRSCNFCPPTPTRSTFPWSRRSVTTMFCSSRGPTFLRVILRGARCVACSN